MMALKPLLRQEYQKTTFLWDSVVGPAATTKFLVGTLEKRETTGYSVHEIPGKPSGVSILTPPGFRKKMLG